VHLINFALMKKAWIILIGIVLLGIACKRKAKVVSPVDVVEEYVPIDEVKIDPEALRIRYLNNMGVIIQSRDETVVIDGFHKSYSPEQRGYRQLEFQNLINRTYPYYSAVDIALVTNNHEDHFEASYLKEYLKKNPKSIAVGPKQVRDAITALPTDGEEPLDFRIERVPYDNDQYTFFHREIEVRGVRCDPMEKTENRGVENVAYLMVINGYKVLHVGDTDWFEGFNGISDFRLLEEKLDEQDFEMRK